jgi:hypothetical protein
MNIQVTVSNNGQEEVYLALARRSMKPEDLFMDPVNFYEAFAKKIPLGEHYELEIIEPPKDFFAKHVLHVHISAKNGRPFVCYPPQVPTLERAAEVFSFWCLGTALTVSRQIDLNTVFSGECHGDEKKFLQVMREKYHVHLVMTKFV